MTKILFTNTNCSVNKGSAAQVISTCETLRELMPDIEIVLISYSPELDPKLCNEYNIKVTSALWIPLPNRAIIRSAYFAFLDWPINIFLSILFKYGLNPTHLGSPLINEYISSDAIIDLSGDSYSDGKGGLSLRTDSTILLCSSLKKPVILYSQSIGPFRSVLIPLAKNCLNRAKMIIVREEITRDYLDNLGITAPMYINADCAFTLKPPNYELIKRILLAENIDVDRKPLIGITPNALTDDKRGHYASIMAQAADYLVDEFDAQVILIPHSIAPKIYGKDNDQLIARKIFNLSSKKDHIKLIQGDYSPNELKGIISQCEIFLGGRMHANIAAISSCVPTIATAWSHKFRGIMTSVDQEKYVIDYRSLSIDELKSSIRDLWENRYKIRQDLKQKVKNQRDSAKASGKLVKSLIEIK